MTVQRKVKFREGEDVIALLMCKACNQQWSAPARYGRAGYVTIGRAASGVHYDVCPKCLSERTDVMGVCSRETLSSKKGA